MKLISNPSSIVSGLSIFILMLENASKDGTLLIYSTYTHTPYYIISLELQTSCLCFCNVAVVHKFFN